MIYSCMTKLAMQIAFDVHKDQVDKGGMPYVFHPFHLAVQMDTEESTIVALLHDVVEDSNITFTELHNFGFSDHVIDALKLLVHDKSIPYLEYVEDIKSNEIARKVKLADLIHNSDITRLNKIDDRVQERIEKYSKAIRILEDYENYLSDTELISDSQIPLDSDKLFFLSIFRNQNGDIEKYSIDVEKACDSHYEISILNMKRFENYLMNEYHSNTLIDGLIVFFNNHNESDLTDLFDALDINYLQFHFDDYY